MFKLGFSVKVATYSYQDLYPKATFILVISRDQNKIYWHIRYRSGPIFIKRLRVGALIHIPCPHPKLIHYGLKAKLIFDEQSYSEMLYECMLFFIAQCQNVSVSFRMLSCPVAWSPSQCNRPYWKLFANNKFSVQWVHWDLVVWEF